MSNNFIPVVGAVVWNSGKVLAAQRKVGTKLGGLWEFPGGKIESRESAKAALVREIKKDDDEGSTFYYLGQVDVVSGSAVQETMQDKHGEDVPVVTMNLRFREAIPVKVYDYFNKA